MIGNVIVKGLTKHKVTNEEEWFNLLFEGESNRTISEHKLNQFSFYYPTRNEKKK